MCGVTTLHGLKPLSVNRDGDRELSKSVAKTPLLLPSGRLDKG